MASYEKLKPSLAMKSVQSGLSGTNMISLNLQMSHCAVATLILVLFAYILDRALNSNKFSGSIPHSLGKLVNVTWLDLSDNQLSGTLPVSNANQSGLDKLLTAQQFHFSQNKLTGSIPPSLFSSDMKLVHVLFDSNDFYGEIPSTLELIQSLEILRLDRNSLTGTIPSNISNLTNLYETSREERLVEKTKAALAMQFGFADMKKIAMIAFLIIIIPMMIIAIAAAGITVNGMARTTYTTFEHVPVPDKLPPNCERVENCSQCSSLTCTLSRVEGWVCCND